MSDILVRAMLNDEVAVCACDITQMAEEARIIHGSMPVGTIALGRVLSAATMLSSMLKNKNDKFTLMINGGGDAGTIMAVGNAKLEMKAYIANPFTNPPPNEKGQFDIARAVGKDGFVTVIRDFGLKEPYVGKTELVSGEIGEDIAHYLLVSEQQPSIVYVNTWLETDMTVLNAGGIIIRPMPGCSEESLLEVEGRIGEIKNYALHLFSSSAEEVIQKTFSGMDIKILETEHPKLLCDCSKERLEQVVISLGKEEIEDMINEDNGAELTCRFCNRVYHFDSDDLKQLLNEATKE